MSLNKKSIFYKLWKMNRTDQIFSLSSIAIIWVIITGIISIILHGFFGISWALLAGIFGIPILLIEGFLMWVVLRLNQYR